MSEVKGETITRSAWNLARFHDHLWATLWPIGIYQEMDMGVILARCHEYEERNPNEPKGVFPANSHISKTGRLEWRTSRPHGDEYEEVLLTIHRPASCVGGLPDVNGVGQYGGTEFCEGRIPVIQCRLRCSAIDGMALEDDLDPSRFIDNSSLAEQRHWVTLFQALQAIGVGNLTRSDDLWDRCIRGAMKLRPYATVPLFNDLPSEWLVDGSQTMRIAPQHHHNTNTNTKGER